MSLPPDQRHLPIKKTARQLIAEMRSQIEGLDRGVGQLDAPATQEGAVALKEVTRLSEAVYDLSFMATKKASEQETAINRLKIKISFQEDEAEKETKERNRMIGDLADRTKAAEARADEFERRLMQYELTD